MGVHGKTCSPSCPHDHTPLLRVQKKGGVSWRCPTCGGIFATLPFLRRFLDASAINSLWQGARMASDTPDGIACPSCGGQMVRLKATGEATSPWLDVCKSCQSVWFDANEFDTLPMRQENPKPASNAPLPQAARETIALFEVRRIEERAERESIGQPDSWRTLLAVLGFPARIGGPRASRSPVVTYAIICVSVLVSLLGFFDHSLIHRFGLVPDTLSGIRLFTLFSSLFFHGNFLHLVENLYFLFLFGPLAEDALGRKRFLLLYFLAGVSGGLLHALIDPRASSVAIGASGCISGIISYVAFAFPSFSFCVYWCYRMLNISAEIFLVIWVFLQLAGLLTQIYGLGEVSAAAHLAGAVVGVIFFFRCGKPRRDPAHDFDID